MSWHLIRCQQYIIGALSLATDTRCLNLGHCFEVYTTKSAEPLPLRMSMARIMVSHSIEMDTQSLYPKCYKYYATSIINHIILLQ